MLQAWACSDIAQKKCPNTSSGGALAGKRGSPISSSSGNADGTLSVEEASAAIDSLSLADKAKLQRVSRFYAGSADAADDLRQEAMLRTLDGTRRCPRDVEIVRHLDQVMRSIIWSVRKQARIRPPLEFKGIQEADFPAGTVVADAGPEVQLAEAQAAARVREEILKLFVDDEVARTVVEGIMLGWEGEELCELAGIDKPALATKRRLISRRITRAFPNGWHHGS